MFPISIDGEIMCATCHNPHDVRKGPKLRINDVNKSCRQCHYKKYGQIVHEDAAGAGQLTSPKEAQPPVFGQKTPSQNDLAAASEDKVPFGYRASLNYYCIGCHANKETGHPYGVTHTGNFVKRFWGNKVSRTQLPPVPPLIKGGEGGVLTGQSIYKNTLTQLSKDSLTGDNLDIQIFPLTLSGQIGCFTCHDPHNGAKGPKLRVEPKETLCTLCHPNRSGIIEKYLKSVSGQQKQGSGQQTQGPEQQPKGTQPKQGTELQREGADQQKQGTGQQPPGVEQQPQVPGQQPKGAERPKQGTGQQPPGGGQQSQGPEQRPQGMERQTQGKEQQTQRQPQKGLSSRSKGRANVK